MKHIIRFTASRKRELVRSVTAGEFTTTEIQEMYAISDEEWSGWVKAYSEKRKMTMKGMISDRVSV